VLVSKRQVEGGDMVFKDGATDAFGHPSWRHRHSVAAELLKTFPPITIRAHDQQSINQNLVLYMGARGDPDLSTAISPCLSTGARLS